MNFTEYSFPPCTAFEEQPPGSTGEKSRELKKQVERRSVAFFTATCLCEVVAASGETAVVRAEGAEQVKR